MSSSSASSTSTSSSSPPSLDVARSRAQASRAASRQLLSHDVQYRRTLLSALARTLLQEDNQRRILAANQQDVAKASSSSSASTTLTPASLARLTLTSQKLATLATGLEQLATDIEDPLGKVKTATQIAEDLSLKQVTVPLGVVLVIFESRPDVLPQLLGLALLSGNGLLLKGGHESFHSLSILYELLTHTITTVTNQTIVGSELVVLLHGREEVSSLLSLDDCIDLVIPRGSNSLVSYIKQHTRIPVLGHADGVCHIYLDRSLTHVSNMFAIIVDAKCDYPAACNAMETLLIHQHLLFSTVDKQQQDQADRSTLHADWQQQGHVDGSSIFCLLVAKLRENGIDIFLGPKLHQFIQTYNAKHGSDSSNNPLAQYQFPLCTDLHTEYGEKKCTLELVASIEEAIQHIHKYGSSHTESILTSDPVATTQFLNSVDSACVFHNASTRFADGFRFGLGAEVGISTSRIHARGPVGVEGLTTTKWILNSSRETGHTVAPFSKGDEKYVHKPIPLNKL